MSNMVCFKEGAINWQEQSTNMKQGHVLAGDALGNPADALLSPYAQDPELGKLFLKWMLWSRGGQEVIRNFKIKDIPLHGLSPYVQTFFGGQSPAGGDQPLSQDGIQTDGASASATNAGNSSQHDLPTSAQCNTDSKYWMI